MPDEHNPEAKKQETEGAPPILPLKATNPCPAEDGPPKQPQKWWKKRIHWAHVFQATGIVLGLLVAWVYYRQLDEMRYQTQLLDEQANRTVIENKGSAAAVSQQLRLLQQQTRVVQDGLATTQRQFRLEQRPIIAVTDVVLVDAKTGNPIPRPILGAPVTVNIYYQNVGHSPAIGVRPRYHMLFVSEIRKLRSDPPDKIDFSSSVIPPNIKDRFVTIISLKDTYAREDISVNPADVTGWDGTQIVIFGRFSYADQFGTVYCLPYMKDLLETGNWADSIEVRKPFRFATSQLCPVKEKQ